MIKIKAQGNFSKTYNFLKRARQLDLSCLEKYGAEGVRALSEATPKDTGLTANSWYYKISHTDTSVTITWYNSNLADGWAPVAVLLQYGHATGTGGWVEGRDYINPAMQPIFDKIAKDAWEEVKG